MLGVEFALSRLGLTRLRSLWPLGVATLWELELLPWCFVQAVKGPGDSGVGAMVRT